MGHEPVEQFYSKHCGCLKPLDGGDWAVGEVVLQRILTLKRSKIVVYSFLFIKLSLFFKFQ